MKVFLSTLSVLVFGMIANAGEGSITCKIDKCTPVEMDPGSVAELICQYEVGPFTLKLNKKLYSATLQKVSGYAKGQTETSDHKVSYSVDKNGAYRIGSADKSGEILGYLPVDGSPGKILVRGMWVGIAHGDFDVSCTKN